MIMIIASGSAGKLENWEGTETNKIGVKEGYPLKNTSALACVFTA